MSQPHSDFGRVRQREIYVTGVGGRRPLVPVDPRALEQAAQTAMTPEAFAYVAGRNLPAAIAGRLNRHPATHASTDRGPCASLSGRLGQGVIA